METTQVSTDRWMDKQNAVQHMHSHVQLCYPTDCSPPGSVHGILQARILEWAAISSSRGSSQSRDQTCIFCSSYTGRRITTEPPGNQRQFQTGHNHLFSVWQTLRGSVAPRSPADVSMEVSTEGWGGLGHKGERCWVDGALRATVTPWDLWTGAEWSKEVWGRKAGKRRHQKAGTHWPEKFKAINCASGHSISQ